MQQLTADKKVTEPTRSDPILDFIEGTIEEVIESNLRSGE